ncbi:acyl binding protein [Neofusicoccum parvum]|uniref:Acyl binding protein n=1 Tax=Neofusicoccum parvum TaxID=310453 RepID=A0ACB5SM82_9PEZI|nr:acyl binding protein [Neofusicoccum parvum]GME65567.1 acyl binding protein [Neofusicoccum parvum]
MTAADDFKKAFEDVKKLKSTPTQPQQLELYAYAKIANGENIEDKKPGMFDVKGKAMKNAWQKKLDEGITTKEAQVLYVTLVKQLQESLGTN